MADNAVQTVTAWHEAVNARDIEGAVALCSPEVEVSGPRGLGRGHELMRAWLTRSGISLQPQHELRETEGVVLVHEVAQWRTTADAPAQAPTEPTDTWVVFRAADGLVTSVQRFETEDEAAQAAAAAG